MSKKSNLVLAMGLSLAASPLVQASPFAMKDLPQGYAIQAADAAKPAEAAKPDAKPAKEVKAKKGEKAKGAEKSCGEKACGAAKKAK